MCGIVPTFFNFLSATFTTFTFSFTSILAVCIKLLLVVVELALLFTIGAFTKARIFDILAKDVQLFVTLTTILAFAFVLALAFASARLVCTA